MQCGDRTHAIERSSCIPDGNASDAANYPPGAIMKIMLYSQHVLGIGHFFRSMEIAKALKPHQVLFVEGGDPLPGFVPPDHVKRLVLPPLMMDADFKSMETRRGSLEEVKRERSDALLKAFAEFAPDVLVTELFPFGRKQFRFELMPLLEEIRKRNGRPKVACSLRDILVEKTDQAAYEQRVLDILNGCYDLLLIHSDPLLTRLDETFERIRDIAPPVFYTGFVVREAPPRSGNPDGKVILASTGGGKVGTDLLSAAIEAVQGMPEANVRLRVFVGPFMEESERRRLDALASRNPRTSLEAFSSDFPAELARADLSITMAGYNTCMDILGTGVRALVYPFSQNREQTLRAERLEKLGVLRILKSLDARDISTEIHNALNTRPSSPAGSLDLNGASRTARIIEDLF